MGAVTCRGASPDTASSRMGFVFGEMRIAGALHRVVRIVRVVEVGIVHAGDFVEALLVAPLILRSHSLLLHPSPGIGLIVRVR